MVTFPPPWLRLWYTIEISGGHKRVMAQTNFRSYKPQNFATGIFKTEFISFLGKIKKRMPSHIWSSHSQPLRLLHSIHVWNGILKIESHEVENPILFEKCWKCPSSSLSCINLPMDNLCKNHQIFPFYQLPKTKLFFINFFRLTVSITW